MQAPQNRDVTLVSITPVVTVTTVPGSREKLRELGEVLETFKKMPARQRRRFEGMTLRETRSDPVFRWHHTAARRSYMASAAGRTRTAPRAREHRPAATRRASSSSSSSGSDPGDPDPEPEPSGELRHVSVPLAAELSRIADRLRARGGVG